MTTQTGFECHAGDDCWHGHVPSGFFAVEPIPGRHDDQKDAEWCRDRHLRWQAERDAEDRADADRRVRVSDC